MQHRQEHRPLDGELEMTIPQQPVQYRLDAALFPQPFEDHRWPEDTGLRGDGLAVQVRAQHGVLVGETSERLQKYVQLTGSEQLIEAAQSAEHPLSHLAVDPVVLHQEQVGARAVGLCSDEQERLGDTTIMRHIKVNSKYYLYMKQLHPKHVTLRFARLTYTLPNKSRTCRDFSLKTVEDGFDSAVG